MSKIPDFIPEGQEDRYPTLRDRKGYVSDFFEEVEEKVVEAGRVEAEGELAGLTPQKGRRGAS